MANQDSELPPFLYGSFDWHENGLFWNEPPPLDLLCDGALASDNPWIVVAAVVERARAGEHGDAARLRAFFNRAEPFALMRVAMLVFGDVAPTSELSALAEVLRGDDADARRHAAEAASLSGSLRLVPAMLDAWNRAEHLAERETIGFAISDMLEGTPGPMAAQVGINPIPPTRPADLTPSMARLIEMREKMLEDMDPPEFPLFVTEALGELQEKLGPDAIAFGGAEWSVTDFARSFLAAAKDPDRGGFVNLRHRFEAATGVDCRLFFHAMKPQRMVMQAALEDFVHSPGAATYEPGRRYFFGHRAPE